MHVADNLKRLVVALSNTQAQDVIETHALEVAALQVAEEWQRGKFHLSVVGKSFSLW